MNRNSVGGATTLRPGFTILEAIVALVIISMVAVGTLAAVGAQLRSTEHAERTTEAVALAEDRMTAIRLLTLSGLQSLPDSIAAGRFAPPLNLYTWRVAMQPMSVSGEDGLNTVTVQIEWPSGAYTLSSRVYFSPLNVASANQSPPRTSRLQGSSGAQGGTNQQLQQLLQSGAIQFGPNGTFSFGSNGP